MEKNCYYDKNTKEITLENGKKISAKEIKFWYYKGHLVGYFKEEDKNYFFIPIDNYSFMRVESESFLKGW